MDPETSIALGTLWLFHKRAIRKQNDAGQFEITDWRPIEETLQRYNGSDRRGEYALEVLRYAKEIAPYID